MASNSTMGTPPKLGKPQFGSHEWLEPIVSASAKFRLT